VINVWKVESGRIAVRFPHVMDNDAISVQVWHRNAEIVAEVHREPRINCMKHRPKAVSQAIGSIV